jgi:hypothetical protein
MTEEGSGEWAKSEGIFNRYVLGSFLIILFKIYRSQGPSKRNSEYFDPCQELASRSIKCIHRNGGDRELCSDYFQ